MQKEINEKTIRLRYIRVLEKFNTKAIKLLKYDNFDLELFKKATIKSYEELQKATSCDLYKQYPLAVKNLANIIVNTLENHTVDFQEEKALILKQSNLLAKLKNNSSYKKEKHQKKKFTDGY